MSSTSDSKPLFSQPSDPSFVHPVSDFPPLSIFDSKVHHDALIVPTKLIAGLRKKMSALMLHRPKTKSIYPVTDDDAIENASQYRKMVLKLDPNVLQDPMIVELLKTDDPKIRTSSHTLTFSYSDWTVEEVLRKLLPVDEVPSSFEIVGHIAHVNLKDDAEPFQYLIGKVILDKNQPRIRIVVNKTGQIETKYRTFGMKVIGGTTSEGDNNWSIVKMKEEGCQFELDFQKVYWNSRLGGEHHRVVEYIRKKSPAGCTVADIMAGVGPFAVPLTSSSKLKNPSKIIVHANDLNPSSYQYLNVNSKSNKCNTLHTYNMDGRAFVHQLQDRGIEFEHAIMNLPATAPEFLDAFRGFTNKTLPEVHVHCFEGKGSTNAAVERCSKALGCPIGEEHRVHVVRNVAPKKNMLCVSFVLPEAARGLPRIVLDETSGSDGEPEAKKARIEESR